ncbi:MAG: hypothetical protein EBU66_19220 [Bacteroidetes bacterium]|nr:hypothetical protein [bacterium]NBP66765.1 hypothetical protein [Bacteroidota bacterium]
MPTSLATLNPDGNAISAFIGEVAKAVINHLWSLKDKSPPPKIESVTTDVSTIPSESGRGKVTVSYTDSDGNRHTDLVPVAEKTYSFNDEPVSGQSANYEPALTEERAIILNGIHDTEHYIDSTSNYASFFDEDKNRIIHDGLMKIFNHEENNTPKEGFKNIVKEILLSSLGLTERDPKYVHIMEDIEKGMGDFRFQEFNEQTANRDAKVANLLKYVYDNTGIANVTSDFMKEWIQELPTLIGDYIDRFIPISNNRKGGQRPKQSYNYAHFIPLKPKSKKSFHDSNSRKVKSRRRKQSRNKHTTRRK